MKSVPRLVETIDQVTFAIGGLLRWLILAAVLISAGNAMVRYGFDLSSNAWLEAQSLLFSAVFLLGAGYALQHNQHVRIDVLSGRLGPSARALIDIFGTLLLLLPTCILIIWLSWPVFLRSWVSGEISSNSGGLPLWPARLLVPAGFALLALQGIAELVKSWILFRNADSAPSPAQKDREGLSS